MSAHLHVFLGDGGVGKTTLAAGYALALAERGGKVALLGIDPARRLQGALGLSLEGGAVRVPIAGELHAALLMPEQTLRRWATEGLADEHARARLLENRLFTALADRLAATTDVIAAVRIAEWAERDPSLTDLVVDTAPGRNGIEFLRRPAALVELLEGRFVTWLRSDAARREPHGLGRHVLRGLGHIAGMRSVADLAELVSAIAGPFEQVLARLERAQAWVHDPSTELLLVTAVREGAVTSAREIEAELAKAGLAPSACIVNRTLAASLDAQLDDLGASDDGAALVRYIRTYMEVQRAALLGVAALSPLVIEVPAITGLDGGDRIGTLTALGRALRR